MQEGVVGDAIPNFARAYDGTPAPKKETLLGEIAVWVISMFQSIASDEHGVEPSLFPIQW